MHLLNGWLGCQQNSTQMQASMQDSHVTHMTPTCQTLHSTIYTPAAHGPSLDQDCPHTGGTYHKYTTQQGTWPFIAGTHIHTMQAHTPTCNNTAAEKEYLSGTDRNGHHMHNTVRTCSPEWQLVAAACTPRGPNTPTLPGPQLTLTAAHV
jgi:hypothetical protein